MLSGIVFRDRDEAGILAMNFEVLNRQGRLIGPVESMPCGAGCGLQVMVA